jgi:hypothetical protein
MSPTKRWAVYDPIVIIGGLLVVVASAGYCASSWIRVIKFDGHVSYNEVDGL